MKFVSLLFVALFAQENQAVSLTQQWGVKDLTDEVVAFRKLSYDDQEKSVVNDSLKEAEQESGHVLGQTKSGAKAKIDLPDVLENTGKARKFDNSDLDI